MDGIFCRRLGPRYDLLRHLGHGSYGEVAQAIDKWATADSQSGTPAGSPPIPSYVAVKRINNIFSASIDAQRILREITILRSLKNGCVIQLLDVVTPTDSSARTFDELYLVFEYVDTDLYVRERSEHISLTSSTRTHPVLTLSLFISRHPAHRITQFVLTRSTSLAHVPTRST